MRRIEYCTCEKCTQTYTVTDDFAQWDVCSNCNKPIEDTYEYLDHYDGEDHCFEY